MRAFLVTVALALFALLGGRALAQPRGTAPDAVHAHRVIHGSAEPFRSPPRADVGVALHDVRAIVEERRGAQRPPERAASRDLAAFVARPVVRRPRADAAPGQWRGSLEPPPPRA